MGKKSKRKQSSSSSSGSNNKSSVKKDDRPIVHEETKDNLIFEDPFEDEYEKEDIVMGDDDQQAEQMVDNNDTVDEKTAGDTKVQSWNPLTSTLDPGTKLEVDDSAYKMHHSLTPEWPALSFDIVRDNLGESRTRFPHSMIVAAGSQADRADRNKLTIMKLSDLARTGGKEKTEKELEDEILGEEYDKEENSDDEEEEDDVEEDVDPILEHFSLRHNGGVNRVRVMPQRNEVVATWSDSGAVNVYNIRGVLDSFNRSAGVESKGARKIVRDPFFVYKGHSSEGYAMDWSTMSEGQLATGDCDGNIHIWSPTPGCNYLSNSSFTISSKYGPSTDDNIDNPSVEDIQWSPTEKTVFVAAECGGYVKIYDTRSPSVMLSKKIHKNNVDVNVISWNPIISNLLASGGDDGKYDKLEILNNCLYTHNCVFFTNLLIIINNFFKPLHSIQQDYFLYGTFVTSKHKMNNQNHWLNSLVTKNQLRV